MLNIPYKTSINISYNSLDNKYLNIIDNNIEILQVIARIESFSIKENDLENSAQILVDAATFNIELKGVINIDVELERLNKDLSKLKNDIFIIDSKLVNKNFIEQAPKQVIDEQKSRKLEMESFAERLHLAINRLKNKI
jgi:valyl-tRNA synthetase